MSTHKRCQEEETSTALPVLVPVLANISHTQAHTAENIFAVGSFCSKGLLYTDCSEIAERSIISQPRSC